MMLVQSGRFGASQTTLDVTVGETTDTVSFDVIGYSTASEPTVGGTTGACTPTTVSGRTIYGVIWDGFALQIALSLSGAHTAGEVTSIKIGSTTFTGLSFTDGGSSYGLWTKSAGANPFGSVAGHTTVVING